MGVETSPTPARYVISLSVHDNMPRQSFCSWRGLHTERTLNDMLCRYYIPAAPLSDFIEDFWLYNDYRPAHLKERILPSGTTELVINLREPHPRFRRILRLQPRRVSPTSTGPSATGHTPEAQPPPAGRIRVNFFQYADCARGDDEPCRLERDHQRWPR